jgi:LemA protein
VNLIAPLLVVLGVAVAVVGLSYAVSYNRFVSQRQSVTDAWSVIDIELQRRHQLVPRLVTAVESAAAHERKLLVELTRRNDDATRAPHTTDSANTWEPPLAEAVARVVALRERYPALNSQQNFLHLQAELATTEDRIAAARRFYNTRVEHLNRRIEAFPSAVVGRRHGFAKAAFFDA